MSDFNINVDEIKKAKENLKTAKDKLIYGEKIGDADAITIDALYLLYRSTEVTNCRNVCTRVKNRLTAYIKELETVISECEKFDKLPAAARISAQESYLNSLNHTPTKPKTDDKKPKDDDNKPKDDDNKPKTLTKTKIKSFAEDVIAGKYGVDPKRKDKLREALKAAGYKGTDAEIKKIYDKVDELSKKHDPDGGNSSDNGTGAETTRKTKSEVKTVERKNTSAKTVTETVTKVARIDGKDVGKEAELAEKLESQQKEMELERERIKQEQAEREQHMQEEKEYQLRIQEEEHQAEIDALQREKDAEKKLMEGRITELEKEIDGLEKNDTNSNNNQQPPVETQPNVTSQNNNQSYQGNTGYQRPISSGGSDASTEVVTEPTIEEPIVQDPIADPIKDPIESKPIIIQEPEPGGSNSNKSSGISSAIPIGLGVAAAGAAAVAGTRYIKNKKNNEEYSDDEEDNDYYVDSNDNLDNDYNQIESTEKYKAGGVNKLVLDVNDEDIKIESDDDDYYDDDFSEELE